MDKSTTKPPVLNVDITVQQFRDAIQGPLCGGSLTSHTIALQHPPGKCRLKTLHGRGATIFVAWPGAILRFHLIDTDAEYRIVGLAFTRVKVVSPTAVYWGIGSQQFPDSPFTVVGFSLDGILEIKDVFPPPPEGSKASPKIFKFTLTIQRRSDGAIGLIDPYIENEN